MLESYIRDGKINIPSEAWTELNQHYTQKEITESLKHHILNGDISLPLKDISWEDAEKSFMELQNYRCSEYMGYLKSKSSLMIFDRHANLKYKYGNRHFWCRGYYVDTVGKYETAIREYIRNQLEEDIANDQISIKEFVDPFTGEQVK